MCVPVCTNAYVKHNYVGASRERELHNHLCPVGFKAAQADEQQVRSLTRKVKARRCTRKVLPKPPVSSGHSQGGP